MLVQQKRLTKKQGLKTWVFGLMTVVLIAIVAIVGLHFNVFREDLFSTKINQPTQQLENKRPDNMESGYLTAQLFVFSEGQLRPQEVKIPLNPVTVVMVESVIVELFKLMPEELRGTPILGVYKDNENVAYIDFSSDLRQRFMADVTQEYLFLRSLYQSIITNIKAIKDVRILIDSKETDTLFGHLNVSKGLKEAGLIE